MGYVSGRTPFGDQESSDAPEPMRRGEVHQALISSESFSKLIDGDEGLDFRIEDVRAILSVCEDVMSRIYCDYVCFRNGWLTELKRGELNKLWLTLGAHTNFEWDVGNFPTSLGFPQKRLGGLRFDGCVTELTLVDPEDLAALKQRPNGFGLDCLVQDVFKFLDILRAEGQKGLIKVGEDDWYFPITRRSYSPRTGITGVVDLGTQFTVKWDEVSECWVLKDK